MKKLIFLCIGIFLAATVTTASAFRVDLTNYGGANHTDINRIVVSGEAEVTQQLGGDGQIDNGETFSEFALLQQFSYVDNNGDTQAFNIGGKKMYLFATGLTGKATNVQGTGVNTTFDYEFDPFTWDSNDPSKSIGIYLDNDNNHGNGGFTQIAWFDLTYGDGAGADGFLGGSKSTGASYLTAMFRTETVDNVFFAENGYDFGTAVLPGFGTIDTTNTLAEYIYQGADKFVARVESTGHIYMNVPEPATLALMGIGLLGLAGIGRRRNA